MICITFSLKTGGWHFIFSIAAFPMSFSACSKIAEYCTRVGYASCIRRTAPIRPEHRSCSSTREIVNFFATFSWLGLMHRMKNGFTEPSSSSSDFTSPRKRLPTEVAPRRCFAASRSSLYTEVSSSWPECASFCSQPTSSASLFFSSQFTSCSFVVFATTSDEWYATCPRSA